MAKVQLPQQLQAVQRLQLAKGHQVAHVKVVDAETCELGEVRDDAEVLGPEVVLGGRQAQLLERREPCELLEAILSHWRASQVQGGNMTKEVKATRQLGIILRQEQG